MKLKKIASLMLAGIMAVSMLAGCKSGTPDPDDNGGASSNTTSSFTESVLSKTNDVTSALLKASSNAKLDAAVEFAAINDKSGTDWREYVTSIGWGKTNWESYKLMEPMMDDAIFYDATDPDVNWTDTGSWTGKKLPVTYWTVGCVSSTLSDDAIANLVADLLDSKEYEVSNGEYTYSYEVRVAKSVCKNTELSNADDDYVIIGVAITCNREAVKY